MSEINYTVRCPKCGAGFEVPEEYLGESAECTQCGNAFVMNPEKNVETPPPPPAETEPAVEDNMNIWCPSCGTQYEVPREYTGQQVECSACGGLFIADPTAAPPPAEPEVAANPVMEEKSSEPPPPPPPSQPAGGGEDMQTSTIRLSRKSIAKDSTHPSMQDHFGPYFDRSNMHSASKTFARMEKLNSPPQRKWWEFWKWFGK